jgi:hypothetical protein
LADDLVGDPVPPQPGILGLRLHDPSSHPAILSRF